MKGEFHIPKLDENSKTKREKERMHKFCNLTYNISFLDDKKYEDTFKIIIFNVQSLNRHYQLVKFDRFLNSCDLLCLLETSALKNEKYDLNEFRTVQRIDCLNERKAFGTISFLKNKINLFTLVEEIVTLDKKGIHMFINVYQVSDIFVISLDKPPKFNDSFKVLDHEIFGEFAHLVS